MQTSTLLVLLAAAAVSAEDYSKPCEKDQYKQQDCCKVTPAPVYKEELPAYRHYDCDATSTACYAPTTYGADYKEDGYKYGKHYPYPGPKVRFCNKLKKIKSGIVGVITGVVHGIKKLIGKVFGAIKRVWKAFKAKWNTWCDKVASDLQRFKDWKACKDQEWKDWWEHYLDLCRTRKQLWDDAMREFHRQWHHYKKCAKKEYEEKKKACKVTETHDYDDRPDYGKFVNYLGVTPVEAYYNKKEEPAKQYDYKPAEYVKTCKDKTAEYEKTYGKAPADVPDYDYIGK